MRYKNSLMVHTFGHVYTINASSTNYDLLEDVLDIIGHYISTEPLDLFLDYIKEGNWDELHDYFYSSLIESLKDGNTKVKIKVEKE